MGVMHEPLRLNDWSFSQLCTLSGVSKDTVNRLSPETASRVFGETLPNGTKPLQFYTAGDMVRSIHSWRQSPSRWNLLRCFFFALTLPL